MEHESAADLLESRYDSHIDAGAELCRDERVESEGAIPSKMFNLLIANEWAVNAAAMLENLLPTEPKNTFAIKVIPWCSHAAMAAERGAKTAKIGARA